MSKAQSNQKGQHMKPRQGSDEASQAPDTPTLDANQSAKSMSSDSYDGVGGDAAVDQSLTPDSIASSQKDESAGASTDASASSSAGSGNASSEGSLMSRAASLLDTQAVKKNLNIVKEKAQDFVATSKDQASAKLSSLSDDVRLRSMLVNDNVKANPYAYALGAVGLGFILGRAFSGKGKGDLDAIVATVNKINFTTLAGLFGVKSSDDARTASKDGYNEEQASKIG